jgi:integrase
MHGGESTADGTPDAAGGAKRDKTARRGRPRGKRGNNEGSVYQRSDGTWCAAVTLDGGKRKVLYGKTRQEVARKLTDALRKKEQGLPFTSERLTVGAWLDYWLENIVKPERDPTTYEQYEIAVRLHTKPFLGATPLAKLQPEHVERWLRELEQKRTSVRTRQVALTRLRTALNLALKRGHLGRNVAVLVERPKQLRKKWAAPSLEALRELLKHITEDGCQALVVLALTTSLRRGEVLGLHWEDIDFEAGTLTVRRRVSRVGKKARKEGASGLLVREGAKSHNGQRVVMLPRIALDALHVRRTRQLEERLAAGATWQGPDYHGGRVSGFVFTSEKGTVLEPRRVDKYFEQVRKAAGLDAHTFHGLRHDFASLLIADGVPGRVVMEMMGHSDYSITANRYQHVPDELQRLAADRIDALLSVAV